MLPYGQKREGDKNLYQNLLKYVKNVFGRIYFKMKKRWGQNRTFGRQGQKRDFFRFIPFQAFCFLKLADCINFKKLNIFQKPKENCEVQYSPLSFIKVPITTCYRNKINIEIICVKLFECVYICRCCVCDRMMHQNHRLRKLCAPNR